ncbi:MAG TPA: hypothetical protein VEC19_19290 [Usitatibacter sp.]|nr:hypothetical protein [Usitatibacter sp.]
MKAFSVSSVAIGFFLGFVVPYSLVFFIGPGIALATGQQKVTLGIWFTFLWLTVALLAPIGAGFLAAHLAKVQPLLHGAAVGLLGAIAGVALSHPAQSAIYAALTCGTGGIVGGWLQRHVARRSGAL